MKFCSKCHFTFWPYLIAIFIAGVTAFLTWLILGYSDFDAIERIFIGIGMFFTISISLSYYMMICMQRHCHHLHHNHHVHNRRTNNHHRPVGV